MLFNSLAFAVFFPAVTLVYFLLPARVRWVWLLAASYYFYMAWEPGYALLIAFCTLSTFFTASAMGSASRPSRRRALLLLNLFLNLSLLFFFKYYNFFADTIRPCLPGLGLANALPYSHYLLPVGISFFTFQALGYSIDVYRGATPVERHFGRFALFLSFFPQLLAGPIARADRLLPQFRTHVDFDSTRIADGLKLMAWGLFQKVVIADRLSQIVANVYNAPESFQGPALALATVIFAFQIYCDFSGYTDIARGAAQVLGFQLMDNFQRPYFAESTADFWRRWHISLSSWFRDYVYLPLGGNRVSRGRWRINILLVFLLSGLWHGADWKYVIWGALHGLYLLIGQATAIPRGRLSTWTGIDRAPRVHHGLRVLITFLLVDFAWIFFRADSIGDAGIILRHLPVGWSAAAVIGLWADSGSVLGVAPREMILALALCGVLLIANALQSRGDIRAALRRRPLWIRWMAYSALLWSLFLFGVLQQKEFIYFVF